MTRGLLRRTSSTAAARVQALAPALTVGLVAALATGCSASEQNATGSKGYIAGDGQIVLIDEADRPTAPELRGEAVGGGSDIDSSAYEGTPLVINVWASWCGPCRAEADDLARAAKRLDGVQFLGVNTRDDPSAAESFVRSRDIPYPSLLDEDGSELLKFYGLYNLKALPTTVVVDTEGRIAAVSTDAISETTLVDLVTDVAREA